MKKLLSLLGVLTISGSAIPTTIAASPYLKQEKLNSDINYQQINNLEILNRNKRDLKKLKKIEPISQLGKMWCGVAVAEMILRYFDININSLISDITPFQTNRLSFFQRILAFLMRTDNQIGTTPSDFLRILNNFILGHNLNNRRQYSIIDLENRYNNHQEFYNLVSRSLNNNMPVAVAYRGTLPWDTQNRNHFMLINGIEGDPSNLMTLRYNVIDPDPSGPRPPFGNSVISSSYWMPLLFSSNNNNNNLNYIIAYTGSHMEEMDIDNDGQCNKNNKRDIIEVWAVPFTSGKVKLGLNYDGWTRVLETRLFNKKENFKIQINCLLSKVKIQEDTWSWWSEDINWHFSSSYFNLLSDSIWNNWSDIENKIIQLREGQNMVITTYKSGAWGGKDEIEIK